VLNSLARNATKLTSPATISLFLQTNYRTPVICIKESLVAEPATPKL